MELVSIVKRNMGSLSFSSNMYAVLVRICTQFCIRNPQYAYEFIVCNGSAQLQSLRSVKTEAPVV